MGPAAVRASPADLPEADMTPLQIIIGSALGTVALSLTVAFGRYYRARRTGLGT